MGEEPIEQRSLFVKSHPGNMLFVSYACFLKKSRKLFCEKMQKYLAYNVTIG